MNQNIQHKTLSQTDSKRSPPSATQPSSCHPSVSQSTSPHSIPSAPGSSPSASLPSHSSIPSTPGSSPSTPHPSHSSIPSAPGSSPSTPHSSHSSALQPPTSYPPTSHPYQPIQQNQQPVRQQNKHSPRENKLKDLIIAAVGVPFYFILFYLGIFLLFLGCFIALVIVWSMIGILLLFIAIPVALAIIIFFIKDSTVMVSKDVEEMMRRTGQLDENGIPNPAMVYGPYQQPGNYLPEGNHQDRYPSQGEKK